SKVTSIKKAFGHFMLKYCYRKYLFLNCPNSNDMGVRILRYMHVREYQEVFLIYLRCSKEIS
ncbi:MAG: hypothetical protein PHS42_05630, partial [Sulfurimonas sp.]|nr:hypothetical protein [Sulfurimonas sp.]MDD3834936.1 hypothetical protein [Sulfurimonas sp.]